MPRPIDVEVAGSSIGPVDAALLTQLVGDLAKTVLLPWINYKAQHQVRAIAPLCSVLFQFCFHVTRV
jgi:hypothetical protein